MTFLQRSMIGTPLSESSLAVDPFNTFDSSFPTQTNFGRELSVDPSENDEGEKSQSPTTLEIGKKRSRKDHQIDPEVWDQWIILAIDCLRKSKVTEISRQYFTIEQELRCAVRNTGLGPFLIFPWFHGSNNSQQRFRQTLKKDDRRGATIEKVIEAVNYFLRKSGRDYSEEEIQFLRRYYENMEIPIPSMCLSTVVEVYNEFRRYHDDIARKSLFLPHIPYSFSPSSLCREEGST
jgi:hypothetical protein